MAQATETQAMELVPEGTVHENGAGQVFGTEEFGGVLIGVILPLAQFTPSPAASAAGSKLAYITPWQVADAPKPLWRRRVPRGSAVVQSPFRG